MCFESLAWATKQELPAMQKIVLVMLADHNSKDGLCFPSYDTLAIECGMTKRSVITQIEKLEAADFLTVERFKNRANRYFLNVAGSETDSLQSEGRSPQSEGRSPEPVINQEINLKEIITTTPTQESPEFFDAEENADEVITLTQEQQECFDWATVHQFWFASTVSMIRFLKVYNRNVDGGLKQQFDAHKKARSLSTANGLNSEIFLNKKAGGNYETRGKFNQYGSLSKHDQQSQRFNDARERAMAQWRADNNIIDI